MYGEAQTEHIKELEKIGGIPEIMDVILYADQRSAPFTSLIAKKLKGETREQTFFNIWEFARKNVRYIEDQPGNEVIKSPGNLLGEGRGDCKSFAVLVGSILQNLGIRYYFRLIWERPWIPGQAHVYVMAELEDGSYFPIDPVNPDYGQEPFYWIIAKRDYPRKGESIAGLSLESISENIIISLVTLYLVNKLL